MQQRAAAPTWKHTRGCSDCFTMSGGRRRPLRPPAATGGSPKSMSLPCSRAPKFTVDEPARCSLADCLPSLAVMLQTASCYGHWQEVGRDAQQCPAHRAQPLEQQVAGGGVARPLQGLPVKHCSAAKGRHLAAALPTPGRRCTWGEVVRTNQILCLLPVHSWSSHAFREASGKQPGSCCRCCALVTFHRGQGNQMNTQI
jgi:hypothetical protein